MNKIPQLDVPCLLQNVSLSQALLAKKSNFFCYAEFVGPIYQLIEVQKAVELKMVYSLERVQIINRILFLLAVLSISIYHSAAAKPANDDFEVALYHTKSDLINQPIEILFVVNNTNREESVTVNISLKIDGDEVINQKNVELNRFPMEGSFFMETLTVSSDHPCTKLIEAHVETSRGKSYDVQSSITIYESLEGQIIVFCRIGVFSSFHYENLCTPIHCFILNNRTAPIRGNEPHKFRLTYNGTPCTSHGGFGLFVLAGQERLIDQCHAYYPQGFDDPVKYIVLSNFTLGNETWEWQQILHMYPNVSLSWFTEPILLRHYQTSLADQTQLSDQQLPDHSQSSDMEDVFGFRGEFVLFCLLTIFLLRKHFKRNTGQHSKG